MDELEIIAKELAEKFRDELTIQVVKLLVKEALELISLRIKKKKG